MSVYTLYRLRSVAKNGYTGFEGRYYSLFESLNGDLRHSVNLQILITALAYKYILNGDLTHSSIPDSPEIESERRQIIFGSSIGIPTFYIKVNNNNLFMREILKQTVGCRNSSRYQGYIRVYISEYQKGLVKILRRDGADLIESLGMEETMRDLEFRVSRPEFYSATAKITRGILNLAGEKKALKMNSDDFNLCAEKYYREKLREKHLVESLDVFLKSAGNIERKYDSLPQDIRSALENVLGVKGVVDFVESVRDDLITGDIPVLFLRSAIHLLLITLRIDMLDYSAVQQGKKD
jgi:hypothetical protein